jgi:hypothetical protein
MNGMNLLDLARQSADALEAAQFRRKQLEETMRTTANEELDRMWDAVVKAVMPLDGVRLRSGCRLSVVAEKMIQPLPETLSSHRGSWQGSGGGNVLRLIVLPETGCGYLLTEFASLDMAIPDGGNFRRGQFVVFRNGTEATEATSVSNERGVGPFLTRFAEWLGRTCPPV